jgi:hypothetical protein
MELLQREERQLNGWMAESFLAEELRCTWWWNCKQSQHQQAFVACHFINESKVHKLVNFANLFIICTAFVIVDQKLTPLSLLNGQFSRMSLKC